MEIETRISVAGSVEILRRGCGRCLPAARQWVSLPDCFPVRHGAGVTLAYRAECCGAEVALGQAARRALTPAKGEK